MSHWQHNGTVPISDGWSGYLDQFQAHLPAGNRFTLLAVVNIPIIIILVNALWQVVSSLCPAAYYQIDPTLGRAS